MPARVTDVDVSTAATSPPTDAARRDRDRPSSRSHRRAPRPASHAVRIAGSQTRGSDRPSRGETTRSASDRPRRAATSAAIVRSAMESVGSKSGSSGSFLISTLTHMPAQASSAASRSGMWPAGRRRCVDDCRARRPVGRRGARRAGRPTVRRTSSSTASAPSAAARRKAAIVFSRLGPGGPAMGEYLLSQIPPISRNYVGEHARTPCQPLICFLGLTALCTPLLESPSSWLAGT